MTETAVADRTEEPMPLAPDACTEKSKPTVGARLAKSRRFIAKAKVIGRTIKTQKHFLTATELLRFTAARLGKSETKRRFLKTAAYCAARPAARATKKPACGFFQKKKPL